MTFADRIALLRGAMTARDIAHGAAPWLTDTLVITAPARARLQRWAAAGGPPADRSAVCCVGPDPINDLLQSTLARIPEPVAEHVVRHCVVAVVGRRTAGWAMVLPRPAHEPSEAPHLVTITAHDADRTPEEVAARLAHECAHSWLSFPVVDPLHPPTVTGFHQAADAAALIDALAQEWRQPNPRLAADALDELHVSTLAREWGFRGRGADVDWRSLDYHRALERTRRG